MSQALRTLLPIILLLVIAASMATSVAALDAGQAAAIDRIVASVPAGEPVATVMARHYAVLLWVEDFCNGRSLETVRAYIQSKAGANSEAFEAAWFDAATMLAKTNAKAMCALALEQYGPDGALIKGAWAAKPE